MTTMLEKMALAIAAKFQDAPVDMNTFSWDDVNGWTRDMAFDCARAALQAIRDAAQTDEGHKLLNNALDCLDWERNADLDMMAMIDAILNEKP